MTPDYPTLGSWQADLLGLALTALASRGIQAEPHSIDATGFTVHYAGRIVRIAIEEVDPVPSDSWPVFDQRPGHAGPRRKAPVSSHRVDALLDAMSKGFCCPEDVVDKDD